MRRPVNRHRRGPDQKRNDAVRRQFQIDREPIERGPSPLPGRSLIQSEMCCQDRASSSILFHSSALSWSFSVAMHPRFHEIATFVIETYSLPTLTHVLPPIRPLGLPICLARVPAARFARGYPGRFTFYVAHPVRSILTSYFVLSRIRAYPATRADFLTADWLPRVDAIES